MEATHSSAARSICFFYVVEDVLYLLSFSRVRVICQNVWDCGCTFDW